VYIKWLHAPGHSRSIGPRVIKMATDMEPMVIDWSEMSFNIGDLVQTAKGYHHFIGPPKRTDRRGRVVNHDVVISVEKLFDVIHQEEFFIGKEIPAFIKYMPERWGKALVISAGNETILVVAWHPQPGPLRHVAAVLPQYRRSVLRVQEKQQELEKQFSPTIVLNGGDLQLGPGKRWAHPNNLAKRLHMTWRNHGIDWQMFKGFGVELQHFTPVDPSVINLGMDHIWTLMTLRKAPLK
jgi:hypothetical protein